MNSRRRKSRLPAAVWKWVWFGLVLAIVPVIFAALRLFIRDAPVTLSALTGQAELLLPAAAISARGIGELLGGQARKSAKRYLAGGSAILILLLSTLFFADVTAAYAVGDPVSTSVIARTSVVLTLCAAIAGCSCVIVAEVK